MAGTPTPKSYEQILGDMIVTYMGKIGINDMNTGSAVSSFFEAVAQAIYRASADTFSILRDYNVDRASGEKLKRIAKEENITINGDKTATGTVTITDTSFDKITTKIYAGANPPNKGSSVIKVSDASGFTATGQIYIGRGTPNVEGPLSYNTVTQVGGFWEITLDSPTVKFHNISESVVLAQGGVRTIAAGEVVKAPASGTSPDINFTITKQAVILDGENVVTGVPVAAQISGSDGNVPRNAIKKFTSAPFTGAVVTNDSPFTTGKNADTDDEIRNAIKRARISRGLGTAIAIKSAVLGISAPDENATVTSNEIFSDGEETTLFIDNGEGYEEKTTGVGLEYIVDSALGGETHFQLATGGKTTSVAKASLISNNTAPFSIKPNDRLAILVGGVLSEHPFADGDFRSNGNATAYEVVASINANPELAFSAATINSGTGVVVFARKETDEFLEITDPTTGNDVSIALGFPVGEFQTLRLYKNKKPLNRNGRFASVTTEEQIDWSNTIISGDTLVISVDKTNFIAYTFTDADFLTEGSYTTVNKNNSLESWVNVINAKVTGVTAAITGTRLALVSNLGASSRASVEIDISSTLVTKGMFTVSNGLSAVGKEADIVLSRNTAQFKLNSPLQAGDSLTAGTEFTKAKIESGAILGGTVNLSSDAYLWFLIDNQDSEIVNTGITADTTITVSKPSANIVRYTSNNATAFANVQVGDYVILWSTDISAANRLEARVYARTDSYIDLKVTPSEYASAVAEGPIVWTEGIAIVRTDQAVQKAKIASGSYNINTVANLLTSSIIGANVTVEKDEILIVTTETENNTGEVFLVTTNNAGQGLKFTEKDKQQSEVSLFAFYESLSSYKDFPLFIHGKIDADYISDPPNSTIDIFNSDINLETLSLDPNKVICMLEPYGSIQDNISNNECAQINSLSGVAVDVYDSQLLRRLRQNDRYYVADTYQFSATDSLVVVLDNDPSNKIFPVPLYRKAITNNTMAIDTNNFRAYDIDSGATAEFVDYFESTFSFQNYRALMKAKNLLDPSGLVTEDALLFRSAEWGRAGERINIGYVYPTQPDQPITHTILVDSKTNIRISLKSGSEISNTIDGTTEFDVTITNFGAYDEVAYTWNTIGTNPTFDAALSSGGYVTINQSGEFDTANTGTFRVVSATATSFTVIRKAGAAVAETNKATLTDDTIIPFALSSTTADEINTYVTDNMSNWITSEIVDDSGVTGAGVIFKSTEEDSNYAYNGIDLKDGLNWIETSDLSAVAPNYQFRFKKALDLPSASTTTLNAYAFNVGEEVRLIPTTARQVVDFINVLAVTGLTTLGSASTSSREEKVQIKTELLGSEGAVQVTGGKANSSESTILQAASRIEGTDLMKTIILNSESTGFQTDQWVKFIANRAQKKDTGLSFATTVSITGNSPTAGKSIISLANRDAHDHHFGENRNFFRDRGRTFNVEKHGSLVCISWNEIGSSPAFTKTVEFNDGAATVSVNKNDLTGYTEYTIDVGSINFVEAQRGDLFTIAGLTDLSNNGTFRVIGVSDDGLTIVVDNINGIDAAGQALGGGAISIAAEIREGDTVVIDSSFATLNQGIFRVVRRYGNSVYIENNNAVEEIITVSDNLRSLGFDGTTQFDVTLVGGTMRIAWNTTGTEPSLENAKFGDIVTIGTDFNASNQGNFLITKSGDNYIECANALAVAETNITITDVLEAHKPSIKFSEYDVTVLGDTFTISGDVFDGDNIGTFQVDEVLHKNAIVVNSILTNKVSVQLEEKFVQVYVEEGLKYSAYKQIYNKIVDPNNTDRSNLIFSSNQQYLKVNKDAGEVYLSAIGKLSFPTTIKKGLDSYRYNTGLIAEANRTVYGDPRDNVQYSGVAAAGAEIFIKAPLFKRIQVSIGIRLNTGIPFSRISEQVRNNVSALINSSPIGQSIAISDIISSVNSIPGVKAVSISSPAYDISNDVIVVNPNEKPLILNIVNDITISKVD